MEDSSLNRLFPKALSVWMFYIQHYKLCAIFRLRQGLVPFCTRSSAKLVTAGANVVSKV